MPGQLPKKNKKFRHPPKTSELQAEDETNQAKQGPTIFTHKPILSRSQFMKRRMKTKGKPCTVTQKQLIIGPKKEYKFKFNLKNANESLELTSARCSCTPNINLSNTERTNQETF